MNFRETLDRHLRAIQERNLSTLIDTLPPDDLILIMADGRLVRGTDEFLNAHPLFRGGDVTRSSMSDPSNALPRFRTL
jgi:hypothetical protein